MTAVMMGVNIMCTLVLGTIIMGFGGKSLRKFSHGNDTTGKAVFRLSIIGYAVYFVVQAIIFAVILWMQKN